MRVLIWLPVLLLLHSPAPLPYSRAGTSITQLSWLEGVWRGRIGAQDFEARYTGPDGGQILSASKYTRNGKAAGFEFERFVEKDGGVVLTPFPDGKSSVSFKMTDFDSKTRRAVFENPSHDFPTKISYQRVVDDSLTILVSGPGNDGKEKVIRYELQAVEP
jgi:hypothetical protein